MKKDRICKYCEVEFANTEGRVFSNHVRWCDKNTTNGDKGRNNKRLYMLKFYEKLNGTDKQFDVICKECNKQFSVIEKEYKFPMKQKYFCSIFCARKFSSDCCTIRQTEDFKKTMSLAGIKAWHDGKFDNGMSGKTKRFTSKGEIEVRSYFINNFSDDIWTFGGGLKYKNESISRDLYSNKLKVCIEYDGIWHFKDIHGQLAHKQHKDALLEEWCLENDYRLIRVRDELYLSDRQQWISKILDEIKNGTNKIVKFY